MTGKIGELVRQENDREVLVLRLALFHCLLRRIFHILNHDFTKMARVFLDFWPRVGCYDRKGW